MFKNKNIAIIGGTGSFGKAFLFHLFNKYPDFNKVVIFSRDEQKQYELQTELSLKQRAKVVFIIGDIRDANRINEALFDMQIVIHAAAMKHMPIAELNPTECYKTNIEGTTNVVAAAISNKIEKVVALSTDKAVLPINVYGASKLFLERIVTGANFKTSNKSTVLSAVRYANVLGSRGSVIPFFLKEKEKGNLPITDLNMTRFSISMNEGIDLVLYALDNSIGGEIYTPKAPSYKITTIAEAICPECSKEEVGIRIGEKLSELMVSKFEAHNTIEQERCYITLSEHSLISTEQYIKQLGGKKVDSNFEYDSATNTNWLSVEDLKRQIANLEK